jgi:hypothetical protein
VARLLLLLLLQLLCTTDCMVLLFCFALLIVCRWDRRHVLVFVSMLPAHTWQPGIAPACALRSLFEKDKLLFAFLLCSRILESKGSIDGEEWLFLLTGAISWFLACVSQLDQQPMFYFSCSYSW